MIWTVSQCIRRITYAAHIICITGRAFARQYVTGGSIIFSLPVVT